MPVGEVAPSVLNTGGAIAELIARSAGGNRLVLSLPDALYFSGLETRLPNEGYAWDGLRRGSDPKHPRLLMQFTLSGKGYYRGVDDSAIPLPRRWGFFAILPSAHHYFLPPEAPDNWVFFWLIVGHPYIVTRLTTRISESGPVWDFTESAESEAVLNTAARLALLGETVRDPIDAEAVLFEFLIIMERAVRAKRHGGAAQTAERETLLAETRRFVENHLGTPLGVPDLARARNMERSRFSHYFHDITGETPARFMTRVRLESAARRLAETDETLDTIAHDTGFADANHLCKVFRRHYHLSPGAYRRQLR